MKNGIVIKSLLVVTTIIATSSRSSEALATMNLTTRCEENFIGHVFSVTNFQTPLSALAKVQVVFQIEGSERASKSKDSYQKKITVLRDGPHKYQVGQTYDVGLNNGFVCRMERLES